jgi:hypothetical protein
VTDLAPCAVRRRRGREFKVGRSDAALIYELRQEGVCWKILSKQFGMSVDRLMRIMQRCRNDGLSWLLKP